MERTCLFFHQCFGEVCADTRSVASYKRYANRFVVFFLKEFFMTRLFKPLLGAVALAAASLASSGALAAYNYNTQITITAPKGSTAESAAKNKTLPSGLKVSTCAPDVNVNTKNPDYLNIAIKYDAGKIAGEVGDVFLVLQDLSEGATNKYYLISRTNGVFNTSGIALVPGGTTAVNLDAVIKNLIDSDQSDPGTGIVSGKFLSATDNLGNGAQTEILTGGNLALAGLAKGLWALTSVITKGGATYEAGEAIVTKNAFLFGRPDTWGAHDTVVFQLSTPFGIDADARIANSAGVAGSTVSAACQ